MRILFTTIPGSGHFNPIVPTAKALQARGHEVTFAASEAFTSSIETAGFKNIPAGPSWLENMADPVMQEILRKEFFTELVRMGMVEGIVRAAKMNSVPVFVIDPVPSMLVPAPLTEIGPVPLSVPFTTRFPVTPSVKVDIARTPVALTVRSVMLLLAVKVTVCPAAITALSPATGTTLPVHVVVALQFPVCFEVIVAALASVLETTQRTASGMHASRTERKILDGHFTFLPSTFF